MVDKTDQVTELEALFSEARRTPPQVPPGVEQRMLADALAHMPPPQALVTRSEPRAPAGFARFAEAFGGIAALGGAMAGLATACVTGFWLGFAPPSGVAESFVFSAFVPAAEAETMFESFDLAVVLGEELQ